MYRQTYLTMKNLVGLLISMLLSIQECRSCFQPNSYMNHNIMSGSVFYQECHCGDVGGSTEAMTWIAPSGEEIHVLGPGTESNVYVVKFHRSVNLHVNNFTKNMSGEYVCVAIHGGKQYSFIHSIEAYEPLHFINTEDDQYIIKGTQSKIYCEPIGNSPPLVGWYKNEAALQESFNKTKYWVGDTGLFINDVDDNDAGVYKCSASVMETGEEVDKYIKVEVITKPEIEDIIITSNNTISVDDFLKIECIASGVPDPVYTWSKVPDGKTKIEANVSWYKEKNIIIFDKIQADDRGTYVCTVDNRAGRSSKEVIIEVFVPPEIVEFTNVTATHGTKTKLVCKASGRPAPRLTVEFDGNDIDSMPDVNYTVKQTTEMESVLTVTFSKINRSHEGFYVCNATNVVDTTNETTYVSVQYKPYIEKNEEIIYGWNGTTVNLTCEHESNPESTVEWRYKKLVKIEKNIKGLWTIYDSYPNNSIMVSFERKPLYGNYTCTAKNKLGEASKVFKLVEAFPPSSIRNISVTVITATSVTFDINGPIEDVGPPIIGYMAEYDESQSYNYTHIHNNRTWSIDRPFKVDGLRPATEYQFRFAALNDVGTGLWSNNLKLVTPEKSVPERPVWTEGNQPDSIVQSAKSESHSLSWKIPEHNGDPVDHYVVRYCPVQDEELELDECIEERVVSSTNIELLDLRPNTTYYVELIAHNSVGNSLAVDMYVRTANKDESLLSAGAIIGLSVVVVVMCLLAVDIVILFWRRQGLIASLCYKKSEKDKLKCRQERDKKGLLKNGDEQTRADDTLKKVDNNGHKEFEYNKSTGVITGKHSAV